MVQNEIDDALDQLGMIKSGDECRTNMNAERLVSQLQEFVEEAIDLHSKENEVSEINGCVGHEKFDVPNHVINGKTLNEVLRKIGFVVGDILCVIKEDANKIDDAMIQILEKIEDLKADAEEKDNAKAQHKHEEILKDLQRCTVNLAYEAEIRGTHEIDAVPIVGMGGQVKTTTARKVYNNGSIVHHFDVRAWCIISQSYNRRGLSQEIFSQVTGKEDKGDKEDILADELKKSLAGKRYLIVLDDMWDVKARDDLRFSFPDVGNRSRIVITTRLEEVAKQVKHHIDPYSLLFLTSDDSLKFLQKKVFQQEGCPPSLQDVSKEVAERCKGLPLLIVLDAGIIKRNKMEASWCHEVKNSLVSYHGESEGYSILKMHLSYDNLTYI
ncbi:hypothetical protein CQW23_23031 [Capsicum baccatum]|uniref:NB-ARC domain-containing protein n=1 Tax=Capsicum baccatum TaxID=33114 RepID=A0A2G2W2L0_CAPBA|nr:hypothetical protein CQW23_23031 [Capsicum baccatum]